MGFPHGFTVSVMTFQGLQDSSRLNLKQIELQCADQGIVGVLVNALQEMHDNGAVPNENDTTKTEQELPFHHVEEIYRGQNYVLAVSTTGKAGRAFRVMDSQGGTRGTVANSDYLNWPQRLLFWVPDVPEENRVFMVQETREQERGMGRIQRRLDYYLRQQGLRVDINPNVATGKSLERAVEDHVAQLEALSFQTNHFANLDFSEEAGLYGMEISFKLRPEQEHNTKLLRKIIGNRGDKIELAELINFIGFAPESDELTESMAQGEGKATVRDGRGASRTVKIGEPSNFTRIIESDTQLSLPEFVQEVQPDIELLAKDLNVKFRTAHLDTLNLRDPGSILR